MLVNSNEQCYSLKNATPAAIAAVATTEYFVFVCVLIQKTPILNAIMHLNCNEIPNIY